MSEVFVGPMACVNWPIRNISSRPGTEHLNLRKIYINKDFGPGIDRSSWCYRALMALGNSVAADYNATILENVQAREYHRCTEQTAKHDYGAAYSMKCPERRALPKNAPVDIGESVCLSTTK